MLVDNKTQVLIFPQIYWQIKYYAKQNLRGCFKGNRLILKFSWKSELNCTDDTEEQETGYSKISSKEACSSYRARPCAPPKIKGRRERGREKAVLIKT